MADAPRTDAFPAADDAQILRAVRSIHQEGQDLRTPRQRTLAFLDQQRLSHADGDDARSSVLTALNRARIMNDHGMPYWTDPEADMSADPVDPVLIVVQPDYGKLVSVGHRLHEHITDLDGEQRVKTLEDHERLYRHTHDYLVACGLLPAPFKDDPRPDVADMIRRAMPPNITYKNTDARLHGLSRVLRTHAPTTRVLAVALLGHGAAGTLDANGGMGTLMLCGTERLDDRWLMRTLVNFRGTLILVVGMCSAGGAPVGASNEAVRVDGLGDEPATQHPGGGFHPECRVVRVASCERHEGVVPSQLRRFGAFVAALFADKPTYAEVLRPDSAWVQDTWRRVLEDAPGPPSLIAAPPLLSASPLAAVAASASRFGDAVM